MNRILIVDDEKNIRLTAARALEAPDMSVRSAVNAEEALQILPEGFDLMLLDLRLPGMGGLELLRRLREGGAGIPVVIVTAHGSVESAVDAMRLGASDFIQKPFAPDELREVVRRVLGRARLRETGLSDPEALFELAKDAVAHRDLEAALALLKRSIAADPGRARVFNLLGAVREMRGEIDEARRTYRAAVGLDPGFEGARYNLERLTAWSPAPGSRHEGPPPAGGGKEKV